MSIRTKKIVLSLSLLIGTMCFNTIHAGHLADSVKLYTPYTKISVPPGQSIDYSIDLINNSTIVQTSDLSISGLQKGWIFDMKSGGYNIKQISVLPGDKKTFSLKIEVPLNVNKGTYRFAVEAGKGVSLPLSVVISEQGSFKTEFISDQTNMQGSSSSTFTFSTNLKNSTSEKQVYALMANTQRGWNVIFKSNYQQVTSVSVEANFTQPLTIEIKPPESVEAGKYKIPLSANTNSTSANLDLEVVVTGTYGMVLTTPTGLLSNNITAGNRKKIDLLLNNTGSAELKDINLNPTAPVSWEVTFDPSSISSLAPGKSAAVSAYIKADKKAIPGDYVTSIQAKTVETSSTISVRMSVETPMLMGWIGVIIIFAAIGCVYYLFKKYGRR